MIICIYINKFLDFLESLMSQKSISSTTNAIPSQSGNEFIESRIHGRSIPDSCPTINQETNSNTEYPTSTQSTPTNNYSYVSSNTNEDTPYSSSFDSKNGRGF